MRKRYTAEQRDRPATSPSIATPGLAQVTMLG